MNKITIICRLQKKILNESNMKMQAKWLFHGKWVLAIAQYSAHELISADISSQQLIKKVS